MPDKPTWSHHNPVRIECAPLETLDTYISAKHVLLVTTPGFIKRGVVNRVRNILASRQITVWDGVKPNPDLHDLDAAAQSMRMLGIGGVVGLGGGSALDAAKVLATTIPSPAEPTLAQVFRHKSSIQWTRRLPLVAIPTTSGTGAEVTPFATVWDHDRHIKHSLTGDFVFPDVALLDATLTLTLGEDDTLYPALDSISHALESLWNKNCTPISRAFAFQSLALSSEALPLVIKDPKNLKARQYLQNASALAGLAISQTRTAIAHAISYPLTTHFGIAHGLACSYGLSEILSENIDELQKNESEKLILIQILMLLKKLNLPKYLKKYKIDKNKFHAEIPNETDRANNYTGNLLKTRETLKFLLQNAD